MDIKTQEALEFLETINSYTKGSFIKACNIYHQLCTFQKENLTSYDKQFIAISLISYPIYRSSIPETYHLSDGEMESLDKQNREKLTISLNEILETTHLYSYLAEGPP